MIYEQREGLSWFSYTIRRKEKKRKRKKIFEMIFYFMVELNYRGGRKK